MKNIDIRTHFTKSYGYLMKSVGVNVLYNISRGFLKVDLLSGNLDAALTMRVGQEGYAHN